MKFLLPAAVLTASLLVAGCNSLDNPFSGWLGSGRDERVYNAQTGQFEWPENSKKRPRRTSSVRDALNATPAPERQGDGRYYDPQKGQWVEAREERESDGRPSKPKATPAAAPVLRATPVPVGTPPPVRPPRARGVYNPSTGNIEWTDFDPAPAAKPEPEKKKSWYWPF